MNEYVIFRQSLLSYEEGTLMTREKLGVFIAEPGVDIVDVQRLFRSGDFLVKPMGGELAEPVEEVVEVDASKPTGGLEGTKSPAEEGAREDAEESAEE